MHNRFFMPLVAATLSVFCSGPSSLPADEYRIDTALGSGRGEQNGHSGKPLEINIGDPFGVEIGPDGHLYATEVRHHRIWRVDAKLRSAVVVAGNGKKGYRGDGGPATEAELNEPYEVRFDRRGNMFFVEMQNHLVRRVDSETKRISTVAGTGQRGFSGDGGPALRAKFSRPHSIALDRRGGLLIADIGNHRIRRVDLKTGIVKTVAGTGEKVLPVDGEIAGGRPVLGPRALFVDGDTLWVALREGHSVWSLHLDRWRWRHVAGSGKKGFSGDGAAAAKATFNGPKGIAVGPRGGVFVVDTENQAIRRIDVSRGVVTTVAGGGPERRGGRGDGGPARQAELGRPHGVCVAADGTVYIGDTLNHRVRRLVAAK